MASFSRLSFSSYSVGGFSIDFEPTPEPGGALNPLAIAVQGIGFGALLVTYLVREISMFESSWSLA